MLFDDLLLNITVVDLPRITNLGIRFAFNLVVTVLLVAFVYYPRSKDKNYVFTFISFNTLVFFITYLLSAAEIGVGVGFGLFALFSIIRYRTLPLPTKEMTYLFAFIATGIANSIGLEIVSLAEVIFMNVAIVGVIYFLDAVFFTRSEMSQTVTYEKIENIKPENRSILIKDLEDRTGLVIDKVSVGRINFLNDTVRVKIHYHLEKNPRLNQPHDFASDEQFMDTSEQEEG